MKNKLINSIILFILCGSITGCVTSGTLKKESPVASKKNEKKYVYEVMSLTSKEYLPKPVNTRLDIYSSELLVKKKYNDICFIISSPLAGMEAPYIPALKDVIKKAKYYGADAIIFMDLLPGMIFVKAIHYTE